MATRDEATVVLGADVGNIEKQLGVGRSYFDSWGKQIKTDQEKYTEWWGGELKKREEMEIDSARRAAIRTAEINTVIGKGSMPAGWAERGAAMKAGKELEQKAMEAAEKGAARGMSHGALREAAVMVREGFRGNFTRMFSSGSILLTKLGLGATQITGIGVVLAEVAAVAMAWWSSRKAEKVEKASETALNDSTNSIAERLKVQLQNLEKAGRISHEEAQKMANRLASPTAGGNRMAEQFIRKHGGVVTAEDLKEMHRLDSEHAQKVGEDARAGMNLSERITMGMLQQRLLKEDMAKMDRNTIAFKQKQLELDETQLNLSHDQKEMEQQKAEQLKQNMARFSMVSKELRDTKRHDLESMMPTLHELATRGAFVRKASDIERLNKEITRDFERGDVAKAMKDKIKHDRLYDELSARNVLPQREAAQRIATLTAESNALLATLSKTVKNGKLKVDLD